MRVVADGFAEANPTIDIDSDSVRLSEPIRLEPVARVRGRVVDAQGKPVSDAAVRVHEIPGYPRSSESGRVVGRGATDEAGAFDFAGAPPGVHLHVRIEKAGYVQSVSNPFRVEPASSFAHPDVALVREAVIEGRLLDDTGKPVRGANVSAVRQAVRPGDENIYLLPAVTGADGAFRIFGLREGSYAVTVKRQRGGNPGTQVRVAEVRAGETASIGDVTLDAPATCRLVGSALGADGRPLRTLTLRLIKRNGKGSSRNRPMHRLDLVTDATGAFRRDLTHDGSFDLEFGDASGSALRRKNGVELVGGETLDVGRLVLVTEGVVHGRVLGAGKPLRDATVRLHGARPVSREGTRPPREIKTDAKGKFSVSGLALTRFTLMVEHADFAREVVLVDPAEPETASDIEIELQRGGSVEGTVVDADGKPVGRRALVQLYLRTGPDEYSRSPYGKSLTDQDGGFRIDGVPAGRYRAHAGGSVRTATGSAVISGEYELRVRAGETTKARIVVEKRENPRSRRPRSSRRGTEKR